LIEEYFANADCRVIDRKLIATVIMAHVAVHPKYPQTMNNRDAGIFMISGENMVSFASCFRKQTLAVELLLRSEFRGFAAKHFYLPLQHDRRKWLQQATLIL
jgi:hypothetical protein